MLVRIMPSFYQSTFGLSTSDLLPVDTKRRLLQFVSVGGSLLTLVSMVSRYYLIKQIEIHLIVNILTLLTVYFLARAQKTELASKLLCGSAWILIVISGYSSGALFYGSITAHVVLLFGAMWLISGRTMLWISVATATYIGYEAFFGQFALGISGSRANAIANGVGQTIFLVVGASAIALISVIMSRQYTRQRAAAVDLEKLNQALQESEARYRLMVDNSAESILIIDLNSWQIIDVNQSTCDHFGYNREQLLSMSTSDLLEEDQAATLDTHLPFDLTERLKQGQEVTMELMHQTAQGKPFLAEVRLVPLKSKQTVIRVSLVDITERKAMQEEMRESWEHLRLMIDNLPARVAYVDKTMHINYGNAQFVKAYGYDPANERRSREAAIGAKECAKRQSVLDRAFAGETINCEFKHEKSSSELSEAISNTTYTPHIVDGQVMGVFLIAVDVTKTRSAEQALVETTTILQAILDHHPSKIAYVDQSSKVRFLSHQFSEFGFDPKDAIGRYPADFLPKAYVNAIAPHLFDAQTVDKTTKVDVVYETINGDEAIDTFEVIPHTIAGKQEGLISISTNVTEQRKTEQALQHSQRAESLGVLAGGIAHDFNNLLAAILSQNSIALRKLPAQHPARRHIDKSVAASKRAATLTQQMLAYSGRGQFEVRDLDLNEMITQNSGLFALSVPKHVQLKLSLQDSLPTVRVDIAQIQQVIMNLIINAVQAMTDEAGQIEISTAVQTLTKYETLDWSHSAETLKPGNYVRIDVSDNGYGMNEETKSRIFDPFFTTKSTGTGLGLAAVLGIVHGHGGGLDVVTKLGVGTTFTILLPTNKQASFEIGDVEFVAPL